MLVWLKPRSTTGSANPSPVSGHSWAKVYAMSMYLSNADLHPTGYEPAEFIDGPDLTGAEEPRRETSNVSDEATGSPAPPADATRAGS
jgi:hypothetical protein